MLFSIIIPVYNAAHTLDKCLTSILDQTFREFEIIAVDDQSTDQSLEVLQRYCTDPRVRVASIPHGGPGAARNAGLAVAKGEYVLFADADDYWVMDDLLQQLQNRICRQPADVFMFQSAKVTEDGIALRRYAKPPFRNAECVVALKDVYQDLVQDGQTLASACNKCVRRTLLTQNAVLFREDILCEDIDWVLQLFSSAQTICLLNLYAYAYTQHKGISRSRRKEAPNDLALIIETWRNALACGNMPHPRAVAGLVAFECGICMGSFHLLSREKKALLRQNAQLLDLGLDAKTKLICRFYRVFGFRLTCLAIRLYLLMRRIW